MRLLGEIFSFAPLSNDVIAKFSPGYLLWRRVGSFTSDVTALGLHRDVDADKSLPFFLRELRKRGFGAATAGEMGLATFMGRPPYLTRHYCAFLLPLDLDDDQLMMEGPELTEAIQRLDPQGWNTEGKTYCTTYIRAVMLLLRVREEILQISLGHSTGSLEMQIKSVVPALTQTRGT